MLSREWRCSWNIICPKLYLQFQNYWTALKSYEHTSFKFKMSLGCPFLQQSSVFNAHDINVCAWLKSLKKILIDLVEATFWNELIFSNILHGWGLGAFLRWWPPSIMGGGFFNLFMCTTGNVWIIPYFLIWNYVLHVECTSCVITNCGQHQRVIPSSLSIALWALLEENTTMKLLSISLDMIFKILLFQVTLLIWYSIAILSPYFLLVGLLLQSLALFQSGN